MAITRSGTKINLILCRGVDLEIKTFSGHGTGSLPEASGGSGAAAGRAGGDEQLDVGGREPADLSLFALGLQLALPPSR